MNKRFHTKESDGKVDKPVCSDGNWFYHVGFDLALVAFSLNLPASTLSFLVSQHHPPSQSAMYSHYPLPPVGLCTEVFTSPCPALSLRTELCSFLPNWFMFGFFCFFFKVNDGSARPLQKQIEVNSAPKLLVGVCECIHLENGHKKIQLHFFLNGHLLKLKLKKAKVVKAHAFISA